MRIPSNQNDMIGTPFLAAPTIRVAFRNHSTRELDISVEIVGGTLVVTAYDVQQKSLQFSNGTRVLGPDDTISELRGIPRDKL